MLRDTTNPKLPLTVGEYKEFGNPRASLLNFDELLHVSPVNALPADGASMFVLTRVGLLDRQVYAYESFKWIQHLRGSNADIITDPQGKYVIYDNHEAHVYGRTKYIPAHAMDLAILDAWAKKQLRISGD
jgi:protease II